MESKKRCPNFTSDEKLKLLQLIGENTNIFLNKKTDGTTNKCKEDAWLKLTTKFNSTGIINRHTDSLKKMWNTLKSTAKIYKSKQKVNIIKTGSGPDVIKLDPILEEVLDIIGRGGIGLSNSNDCDTLFIETIDIKQEASLLCSTSSASEESIEDTYTTIKPEATLEKQWLGYENQVIEANHKSFKNRRRPPLLKEKEQSGYIKAKIMAIENEDKRAAELHCLAKRKLEQDVEIREIILNKMRNNESVDPSWSTILSNKNN